MIFFGTIVNDCLLSIICAEVLEVTSIVKGVIVVLIIIFYGTLLMIAPMKMKAIALPKLGDNSPISGYNIPNKVMDSSSH
jgi:hypothetical protein